MANTTDWMWLWKMQWILCKSSKAIEYHNVRLINTQYRQFLIVLTNQYNQMHWTAFCTFMHTHTHIYPQLRIISHLNNFVDIWIGCISRFYLCPSIASFLICAPYICIICTRPHLSKIQRPIFRMTDSDKIMVLHFLAQFLYKP